MNHINNEREKPKNLLPSDFYYNDKGLIVLSETFHINRGHCCGNRCMNCPYEPKYQKGNTYLVKK
jgi:hypothetical protein